MRGALRNSRHNAKKRVKRFQTSASPTTGDGSMGETGTGIDSASNELQNNVQTDIQDELFGDLSDLEDNWRVQDTNNGGEGGNSTSNNNIESNVNSNQVVLAEGDGSDAEEMRVVEARNKVRLFTWQCVRTQPQQQTGRKRPREEAEESNPAISGAVETGPGKRLGRGQRGGKAMTETAALSGQRPPSQRSCETANDADEDSRPAKRQRGRPKNPPRAK